MKHSGVSRVRSFRNVIVNNDVNEDLKQVSVATTLLAGMRDRNIYMENLKNLVLPQTIALEIVDATHHIPMLMPEVIVKLLNKK